MESRAKIIIHIKEDPELAAVLEEFGTLEKEKIFRLEKIYYDLDKWNIRPDAAIELDKLVTILNAYPKMKIELSSHTDCRASWQYNQKLSQKRAESAKAYIVEKGISEERIVPKGFGETMLVNQCKDGVNCSEEEHQQNRRTEVIILEM